jgi:hypothetical protein
MPTYQQLSVGKVQHMAPSTEGGLTGPSGYGFNIIDQGGKPLLSIMYSTESEAKEACAVITKAIAKAITITTHGS